MSSEQFLFNDPKFDAPTVIGFAEQFDAQDNEAGELIAELAAHCERMLAMLDCDQEITDAEIDAVYNLRWRGHEPVETGCAINNARALIRQELGAARAALEAVKHAG